MNTLKKVLFPLFSLFLLYRSVELLRKLVYSDPQNFEPGETLLISFLLTLYITGVFALTGFAYPTSRILPSSYYSLKNPNLLVRTYKLLCIHFYRRILLFAYWGREKNSRKYFNGTRSGLKDFIYQTQQSEFGHLAAMIFIGMASVILLWHKYYILTLFVTIINIMGNLYPLLLQRYHRVRIEQLLRQ